MQSKLSYAGILLSIMAALCDCGGTQEGADTRGELENTEPIDLSPKTLSDAAHSIAQIDAILSKTPGDARALAARVALNAALEKLNHLLAAVQLSGGHVVQFYEPTPGAILISERYPQGETATLKKEDYQQLPADLYRHLTGSDIVPTLLANAQQRAFPDKRFRPSVSEVSRLGASSLGEDAPPAAELGARDENVSSQSSALTANDGQFFRDTECFQVGSSPGLHQRALCRNNWFDGGFFDVMAGKTGFKVAPFSGNSLTVTMFYNDRIRVHRPGLSR